VSPQVIEETEVIPYHRAALNDADHPGNQEPNVVERIAIHDDQIGGLSHFN
jgi:hypothetical protein